MDPAHVEQLLPAPGHRPDRADHDRHRAQEVGDVRVRQEVQRLREVDLPDQVGGAETRDGERPCEPEVPVSHAIQATWASAVPKRTYSAAAGRPRAASSASACTSIPSSSRQSSASRSLTSVRSSTTRGPPSPSRRRVEVSPCSTPSALGGAGREARCDAAAEQRREGAVARPGGDCHLCPAGRLLGQPAALAVERPDHGGEARLGVAVQDRPACLRDARLREPRALAQARGDEHAGLGRDRVREPEARCQARGDRGRRTGADDAVDATAGREPFERDLVVWLEDRAAVCEPEPRSARVAVDRDHVAAARAGGCEQPGLPRAEHEQPHESRPYNGRVTSILGERVAELRADREHGASWMARRAVEALAETAMEPAASGEELLDPSRRGRRASWRTAGRESARSPARSGGCWQRLLRTCSSTWPTCSSWWARRRSRS